MSAASPAAPRSASGSSRSAACSAGSGRPRPPRPRRGRRARGSRRPRLRRERQGRERRTGSSRQRRAPCSEAEDAARGTTRFHNGRCNQGATAAAAARELRARAMRFARNQLCGARDRRPRTEEVAEIAELTLRTPNAHFLCAVIGLSSNGLTRGGTISTLGEGDPHMRDRTLTFLGSLVLATAAAAWLATGPLAAPGRRRRRAKPAAKAWTPPRTPDGNPDLSGLLRRRDDDAGGAARRRRRAWC